MSDDTPREFRIYCLCGQKMKVTRGMFGKPGKCVACRQKIRIPDASEAPADGAPIYLKEHPEYLRGPKRSGEAAVPSRASESPEGAAADEAVPAAGEDVPVFDAVEPGPEVEIEVEAEAETPDGEKALPAVAFAIYEPVRFLCSYEHAVDAQLQALREGRKADHDKATLMSYRGLARKARKALEKQIHDELSAVSSQERDVRDALSVALVGLRTGEIPFVEYSKRVLPLRQRQEALAIRAHNLRGWLAADDPHVAGGALDVALSDVPLEQLGAPFPVDSAVEGLPIEYAILRLDQSLRNREKADRRLNELHRQHLDGALGAAEMTRQRAEADAARERARAEVAYYRSRLQQVVRDCEADSEALKAYQEVKRREVETLAIARNTYEEIEAAVFRAQVDIKRARNLATRALNANTVSDVPNPRGTFLERLGRPGDLRGIGLDSWLAWAGSALLLTVIFVPIVRNLPGGNAAMFPAFTLALFAGASTIGLCATVGNRAARAVLLCALWLGLTVAGAAYMQGELNGTSVASVALRAGGPWWSTPGGLLLICGWALTGASVIASTLPLPGFRWIGLVVAAAGALGGGAILADYAGVVRPEPVISTFTAEANPNTGTYDATVRVMNAGRRPYWIGGDRGRVPAFARLTVERRIAGDAWEAAGAPASVIVDGATVPAVLGAGLQVPAGAVATLHYALAPGSYRVRLEGAWPGAVAHERSLELEAFQIDLESFFNRPGEASGSGSSPNSVTATVELRGVMDAPDSAPQFSMIVTLPDGSERRAQFGLGDTLAGDWKISEFNPSHNTVTVTDGERIIILERGQAENLP